MSFASQTPLVGSMIAGKYRLIRRLGVGGMGDVYLARVEGLAGFEKHVAVKLLHEHLVGEEMVMESFLAEARLAANLSHANIAQLYDLGQSDGMYFIAMEYVSGLDLRALMAEAAKRDERLPIPLCCHVVARLCDGLDHAHRKRDAAGRPLKLVHRDVSPSNCLVSFSGEVKLIDFGIAKAAGENSRTRTGMIKGKTAYLSPEQVQGWSLDRRSDVFSVGIVLYELLCGPRPFAGESELSVMEAIRDVRYLPPGDLDPDLPPGLSAIVTRALAKDPQARYQWASEMVTDLEGYLFSRGELISARDVAEFIKGLVGGSRAVVAAEVLAPDPDPPTGATRSLKSRSRVRLPPARPVSAQAPVLPPPPAPDPTQVTATPPKLAVPTEVRPPPQPPQPLALDTEVGPPPTPPEPPTDVGPPPETTQPDALATHGGGLRLSGAPSRMPAPPLELGVPTGIGSAATLPGARPARSVRVALVVVLAFAAAGGAGFAWQRLSRPAGPDPETEPIAAVPPPTPAPSPPPEVPPAVEAKDPVKPESQTTMAAVKPVTPPAHPAARPPPTAKPPRPQPVATAPATPATRSDSAYLNLRSNRPAEIFVDGKSIGRTPQPRYALPPGRHELRFDCVYDWGKARGEVQSLYLVPYAEGDVTHECLEMARP